MTKKVAARRNILFARDPHCFWCTRRVVHPKDIFPSGKLKKGVPIPDNMATLDHLDSRLSGTRHYRINEERTVLSCFKCNQERSVAEQKALGLKELQRRAKRAPQDNSEVHDDLVHRAGSAPTSPESKAGILLLDDQ